MAMSYFDLGVPNQDIQAAAAETLQTQQDRHLAVLPAASLAAPIRAALARRQAGQQLELGAKRLALGTQAMDIRGQEQAVKADEFALRKQQYGYEQRMQPWGLGLSALGAGVNLASGYGALRESDQVKARAQQRDELMQSIYARDTINTMRQVGLADSLRALLERQARPTMPSAAPDWGTYGP